MSDIFMCVISVVINFKVRFVSPSSHLPPTILPHGGISYLLACHVCIGSSHQRGISHQS